MRLGARADVVGPLAAGYLGNTVLPARLGEVVRIVLISRRTAVPATAATASVVVERVVDLLALLAVATAASGVIGATGWLPFAGDARAARRRSGVVAAARGTDRRPPARAAARRGPGRARPLPASLRGGPARRSSSAPGCSACSPGRATRWWSGCARRRSGIAVSPGTAVLIAAGAAVGAALPAAAGYLGTYELGAVTMAAFAGVPADEALQIALLAHAIAVLPLAVVGLVAVVVMVIVPRGPRATDDPSAVRPGPMTRLALTVRGQSPMPGRVTLRRGTPELSVVVPVFKEGEAVDPVLRALTAGIATDHEILVVYDFDEDPTVPVIERLHAELPAIRGLRNDLGRGVLNAMKAGIAASRGDYVLVSMADGSDEPHIVDAMVALARDGADVVAASRYMKGGHQVGGPFLKRLMIADGRA